MNYDVLSNIIITKTRFSTTMYSKKGAHGGNTKRPCWAIIIKYEGDTLYTTKRGRYVSDINNVVILPKGLNYQWHCTNEGHYSVIEFESESEYDDILYFPNVDGEMLLKCFKDLEYRRTAKKIMYEIENIKDTYSLIVKLLKSLNKKYVPTDKWNKISPAMEYMIKNYNKKIKCEELSRLCGISNVYFRKLFIEAVGCAPIEYLHKLRIKKAKEMLKSDYGNITDIAHSLGYLNIYDFSRAFKKYAGVPPSKF